MNLIITAWSESAPMRCWKSISECILQKSAFLSNKIIFCFHHSESGLFIQHNQSTFLNQLPCKYPMWVLWCVFYCCVFCWYVFHCCFFIPLISLRYISKQYFVIAFLVISNRIDIVTVTFSLFWPTIILIIYNFIILL